MESSFHMYRCIGIRSVISHSCTWHQFEAEDDGTHRTLSDISCVEAILESYAPKHHWKNGVVNMRALFGLNSVPCPPSDQAQMAYCIPVF
jgi:hypothetical protein